MFGFIKKMFIEILSSKVCVSSHTKCTSLSNRKRATQLTITKFYPNEQSLGFLYYPIAVNLDRCVESCNTLND